MLFTIVIATRITFTGIEYSLLSIKFDISLPATQGCLPEQLWPPLTTIPIWRGFRYPRNYFWFGTILNNSYLQAQDRQGSLAFDLVSNRAGTKWYVT